MSRSTVIGVILAAGRGVRMRSRRPKVLFPVGGVPLVGHSLRALEGAGAQQFVVVTGHEAESVEGAIRSEIGSSSDVQFVRQDPPRGTGDAVFKALNALSTSIEPSDSRTLLVVNGDLPALQSETLREFLDFHRQQQAAMTILSVHLDDPTGYGRLIRGREGTVRAVVEESDASDEEKTISDVNGGLYAVQYDRLAPILADWCRREERRLSEGGPGPKEIYFPPVVGPLAAEGERVLDWPLPESRVEELQQVNDRVELAQAERLLCDRRIAELQRSGVTVVDPGQTWIECDVEVGPDTTIHPGCVIRRGVRIGSECEIGPQAHLREGTVLGDDVHVGNFVEVKKTRIGSGTRAKHLTYLGNGEIGERVNLGAGTILANYDGSKKSTTIIEDGAFIGSGTIIVAPAQIGSGATTGAGALVTRGTEVPSGKTVVGVPARPIDRSERRNADSPSH